MFSHVSNGSQYKNRLDTIYKSKQVANLVKF